MHLLVCCLCVRTDAAASPGSLNTYLPALASIHFVKQFEVDIAVTVMFPTGSGTGS
jgi:hypothetical protein